MTTVARARGKHPWPTGFERPHIPPAPPVPITELFKCAVCQQRIGADRLHFVLFSRALVCGSCVSKPAEGKYRTVTAPLAARVRTYGRREVIAALLLELNQPRRKRSKGRCAA